MTLMLPEGADLAQVDLSTLTLEQLAERANAEHFLTTQSLRATVVHAVRAGEALIELKRRTPIGEWLPWIDASPMSRSTVALYMRLAYHKRVLPDGGAGLDFREAKAYVAGLSKVSDPRKRKEHPLAPEARRLRGEGLSHKEVADLLGVSESAVRSWIDPERHRKYQRDYEARQRRARAARRALAEKREREERDRLAKERGGNLGKAYDQVRKLQPIIDAAISEGLTIEARALAVRLEDEIMKALRS